VVVVEDRRVSEDRREREVGYPQDSRQPQTPKPAPGTDGSLSLSR
jgi:hypothetical protein